jgi:hypothetical protein
MIERALYKYSILYIENCTFYSQFGGEIQWNLSKPNLLGTNFCVQNREVFSLYRLNQQRYPTLGLSLKSTPYEAISCVMWP